ncbi:MAG: hypothetical protein ACK58T_19595, partial [Phycisphaerae bacterium]
LAAALARLTSAPAGILGLQAGRLAKGAAADLVLFVPDRAWRVREAEFRSKSKNSPFDGRPLQGRVLRPLVNGETIFRREESSCPGRSAGPIAGRISGWRGRAAVCSARWR